MVFGLIIQRYTVSILDTIIKMLLLKLSTILAGKGSIFDEYSSNINANPMTSPSPVRLEKNISMLSLRVGQRPENQQISKKLRRFENIVVSIPWR
jgi:hypothetical protein